MSKIKFDGAGFKAEELVAKQFNAKLVTDKAKQYKDIDAYVKTKKGVVNSVSIKDQMKSSRKFGGIQVETYLTNTRNGKRTEGCFLKCKAKHYFWRVWTEKHGDTWLIIDAGALRRLIKSRRDVLKRWTTNPPTEAKNRSYNRFYDRAEGFTIPVKDVIPHALCLKPVIKGID